MDEIDHACAERSPYVGPRPIQTGEVFLARGREARALIQRLLSSRVVLLHSPSGAGKTSLIQAAVLPELKKMGFQLCVPPGDALVPLRVNGDPPADLNVKNTYSYSAVESLLGHELEPREMGGLTLTNAFDRLRDDANPDQHQLIAFDQFEEILNLRPSDREGQEAFFDQLGEALEDERRWALLSMREDFMGGLDRFRAQLPGRLRSTFRLDLMERPAAIEAIRGPAGQRDVEVSLEAAEHLVDDLQRSGTSIDRTSHDRGRYVLPMLLQVVCHNLWRRSCRRDPDFSAITLENVKSAGKVESALRRYYDELMVDVIDAVAPGDVWAERRLRDWLSDKLISADGYRRQTRATPPIADAEKALRRLNDGYLVRVDIRDDAQWWELSHDRLIEAVTKCNAAWRREKLERWQIDAMKWHRDGQRDDTYLAESEWHTAKKSLARLGDNATDAEKRYVERSREELNRKTKVQSMLVGVRLVSMLLALSLALNVAFLLGWVFR